MPSGVGTTHTSIIGRTVHGPSDVRPDPGGPWPGSSRDDLVSSRLMTADAELLKGAVKEVSRLLQADGAMIYLVDEASQTLRFAHDAGITDRRARRLIRDLSLPLGVGMFGTAVASRALTVTDDYQADRRFAHSEVADEIVNAAGMRSMAVTPLIANERVIGAMGAYSNRPAAFSEAQIRLLRALGDHAATAIANRQLNSELAESVRQYRFLVDNSPDLIWSVDRDGLFIYLSETSRLLVGWAPDELLGRHFAEVVAPESLPNVLEHWQRSREEPDQPQQYRLNVLHRDGTHLPMEINGIGKVVDGEFAGGHGSVRDIRERVALEEGLRRRTVELSRALEVQRTLGEIARQIVEVDDSRETLQQVVDASKRLLDSDGAHLTLMDDDGQNLVPMAVANDTEARTREWLRTQRFPLDGGINGLAATTREAVWTDDYLADPRIARAEKDESVQRLGLGAVAVAPLFGSGGEVIGTLAITYRQPRSIDPRDVALLEELAGQGSIAARNARLYEQLRDSERRYRHLVDNSPDLVFSVDADGTFTYLGDALERMSGFKPEEILGKSFQIMSSPETAAVALQAWHAMQEHPDEEQQVRLDLPLAGGGTIAAEISMVATLVNGEFAGAHGSVRDIRERERLEQDLRRQAGAIAANEERANLARELHDSVTQALFSMGLTMRALELLLDRDPDQVRQKLRELQELQKDALAEMRTLIFELRPQGLETDGLAQALRNHGAAVQGRTGLAVSVEIETEERLTLDVEEAFYRIAQEALHNVVKHATATQARIILRRVGGEARLIVEDDGVGFDPAAVPRGHLGLIGMQQRAERIGGELEVGSRPGRGTRVRVTLNLRNERRMIAPALAVPAAAE
jgi:PAS domain S-box-containing protein